MVEGDRVETPRGPGVITRITYQSSFVFGKWERDTLVVVRLDENPEGHVRPVFFAHQLRPEEASSAAENQAESLAMERWKEEKHGRQRP